MNTSETDKFLRECVVDYGNTFLQDKSLCEYPYRLTLLEVSKLCKSLLQPIDEVEMNEDTQRRLNKI